MAASAPTRPRLGLSTVYGIVKHNDGHLVVESARGVGTSFGIYLRRVAKGERPEILETSVPAVSAPTKVRAGVMLVVEDEESVRALVRRVLDRAGYQVLEACDGDSPSPRRRTTRARSTCC